MFPPSRNREPFDPITGDRGTDLQEKIIHYIRTMQISWSLTAIASLIAIVFSIGNRRINNRRHTGLTLH